MYYSGTDQWQRQIHSPLVLLAGGLGCVRKNCSCLKHLLSCSLSSRPWLPEKHSNPRPPSQAALTSESLVTGRSGCSQPQMKGRVVSGLLSLCPEEAVIKGGSAWESAMAVRDLPGPQGAAAA